MSEDLKRVPAKPVDDTGAEEADAAMYCRTFDEDRNVLGCVEKASEASCQLHARQNSASYYSYTTISC